ncbi:ser/Thr protein phosphatase family protein [Colletotrichum karsti]|uniref:Ser/Thr protein phosphatase family protein n=1 Tax=Colletotrichum karsti TaxID=1095194 RepID=A0A9P6LQ66_9PEZI|nr:ser/Thr protein phosphatase family protein [Colletotrichum karsti]KAF9881968.1 ser/Thr protein phosphatase family protein [Colletotrichum karsti]
MESSNQSPGIRTRILIISDTHGADSLPGSKPLPPVDVAIHCGDLTEESKLAEYQATINLMNKITAPLKIVIAGNHDFTLDTPVFRRKIAEIPPPVDTAVLHREYGAPSQARQLLLDAAAQHNITFLDREGTHRFVLPSNNARLTLYASPFTPGAEDWAFQYDRADGHAWDLTQDVDVVVTHGPPRGIFDRTASAERIGCAGLFAAVSRARPRLHCFGHVHRGWGARVVRWRRSRAASDAAAADASSSPSAAAAPAAADHFTDIDHERSVVVEDLARLSAGRYDSPEVVREKEAKRRAGFERGYASTSHCAGDERPLRAGEETLFVNAAIKGDDGDGDQHLSWIVDIELPEA